eukprot:scaffold7358_cov252-Pinguiococcus_pyrenoidosus.AAC.42
MTETATFSSDDFAIRTDLGGCDVRKGQVSFEKGEADGRGGRARRTGEADGLETLRLLSAQSSAGPGRTPAAALSRPP